MPINKKFTLLIFFLANWFVFQAQIQIGNDIDGENEGDVFGTSVSMSADGKVIAIGAPRNSDTIYHAGHVRVYELKTGNWYQLGSDINGKNKYDWFGYSVAVSDDGKRIVVGSYNSQSIRVYEFKGNEWIQVGQDINGGAGSIEVNEVAISFNGKIIAVGASLFPQPAVHLGVVRVYEFKNGEWLQIGNDVVGENEKDQSGFSISLSSDGNTVAIGSISNNNNGDDAGHVRIFKLINAEWVQAGKNIEGKGNGYSFGWSVSLSSDGNIIAVGGHGSLYYSKRPCYTGIYELSSGSWTKVGHEINGYINEGIGWDVNLSADGRRVAISSSGNKECPVRIFDFLNGEWQQVGKAIKRKREFDHTGSSIGMSKNGKSIAAASIIPNGFVHIYDISKISIEHEVNADCEKIDSTSKEIIEYNIYPNPTSGKITIQGIDLKKLLQENRFEIFDILGRIVDGFEVTEDKVDITFLSAGIYFIKIENKIDKVIKIGF